MADEAQAPTGAVAQPGAGQGIVMRILGQYIRDMSFENILVQKGVQGEIQPDLTVEVALDAKKRTVENQYEDRLGHHARRWFPASEPRQRGFRRDLPQRSGASAAGTGRAGAAELIGLDQAI